MESNQLYPPEITHAIQAFVDRIEAVLIERKLPRSQRANICDEVESQIQTLIDRRVESGATLNLELVNSIIESMDQPESYAMPDEPIVMESVSVPTDSTESTQTNSPKSSSKTSLPNWKEYVPQFIQKRFASTPHVDSLALFGLACCAMGILFIAFALSMTHGNGPSFVFALLLVFMGTIACAVSFWRIRQSNGKLLGIRYAAMGLLTIPFLIANTFLMLFLFATPLWMVLGGVLLAGIVLYSNYRALRFALGWLETSSIGENIESPSVPKQENATVEPSGLNGATL
jgi:hypothetical protein